MLGWRPRVLADMASCSTACSLGVEPLAEMLGAEPAEDSFLISARPGGVMRRQASRIALPEPASGSDLSWETPLARLLFSGVTPRPRPPATTSGDTPRPPDGRRAATTLAWEARVCEMVLAVPGVPGGSGIRIAAICSEEDKLTKTETEKEIKTETWREGLGPGPAPGSPHGRLGQRLVVGHGGLL